MDLSFMPAVNASLNGMAFVTLIAGWLCVKRGRVTAHRRCMLTACGLSGLFLVCYITHYAWRASVQGGTHTLYRGTGIDRTFYYAMLISHILLAMTVPVFAIWLVRLGLAGRYALHKKVARIGFPIWLYVSLTGVLIYVMLYQLNPPGT